jgi:hypothetical protein
MLDIKKVACSWVESVFGCKAIFGQNGYFKDGNPNWGPSIAWDSVFEKEMVNYDADFKRIISFLKNKVVLDHSFKLAPDVYESDERSGPFKFKAYYPTLEEALNKKIPQVNSLQVVHFLRREGALQPDRIAFNFCPNCGSKNVLSFRMQEKGCDACDYAENPDCDENCPEYDSDIGCMTHKFPKICCPGASDGDCDGARILEASCANCGYEYADSIVDFKTPGKREVEDIENPEDCDCFAIYYKLTFNVLAGLEQGRTFEGMIRDEIKNQGWNIVKSQGRRRGRSRVDHDVDILCEKNHEIVLIECKRIDSTKSITLGEVYDLFARMYDLEVKKGVIVTTSVHVVKEADIFSKHYGIRIVPIAEFLARTLEDLI